VISKKRSLAKITDKKKSQCPNNFRFARIYFKLGRASAPRPPSPTPMRINVRTPKHVTS